uniref:CDT1 Geminin-binding domain-containing protein n=1 Tax=Glossina morsitans morsitans TaxID=37546 RepID=A0A1B0G327_GLOMM
MAQPPITSFFNTRKRAIAEDFINTKTRPLEEETNVDSQLDDDISKVKTDLRNRSGRTVKRFGIPETIQITGVGVSPRKMTKIIEETKEQKNLVECIKKDSSSPTKAEKTPTFSRKQINETTPCPPGNVDVTESALKNSNNDETNLKTPTKQIIKGSALANRTVLKSHVKKELNFDEVKTKISRSSKLQELKASLARIKELEKTRKAQENKRRLLKKSATSPCQKSAGIQLKEFDTIELEVFSSPSKVFKTPTKLLPATPDKNELMSPRHTNASKRLLFSPSKDGSPSKIVALPAYQRFLDLIKTSKCDQLALPNKYRHLLEVFKGLDSVCAMFYNRKECITFKKLRPAVQRMLLKNFSENHLAQIKTVFPDAYTFTQMKMRNYGSISKADYFQLVITPNVDNAEERQTLNTINENNVLAKADNSAMNPHMITQRLHRFRDELLKRVKIEHDKFLRSLDPPLLIPKEKVTRWHPDFDLENCPDIELAHLPQPPNTQKYSSAKDILLTTRNLFHYNTRTEKADESCETDVVEDGLQAKDNCKNQQESNEKNDDEKGIKATEVNKVNETRCPFDPVAIPDLLKGVPKALLEKIRAKQAAKALEAMTRRPSQDKEAVQYSRLPELARYLRNIFITERKGVLTQEVIIKKIQNSFRICLSSVEIEHHLQLIAKEMPKWLTFHEVRKTVYLKINKQLDLGEVIERLETLANDRSKI